MRFILFIVALLAVTACHQVDIDDGPNVPTVEVHVRRIEPNEPIVTLGHHDEQWYIDAKFLVLGPKEYQGLIFRLKIIPEACGQLFDAQEFRLRLAENLVLGKDRERMNADGTMKVWADTHGFWNFVPMTLEVIKEEN